MAKKKAKNLYAKKTFVSKAKFKKTSISNNPSRLKWSSMNKHKRKNRKKR
jgi:hypothetical protein